MDYSFLLQDFSSDPNTLYSMLPVESENRRERYFSTIGQRYTLSVLDAQTINSAYCPGRSLGNTGIQ